MQYVVFVYLFTLFTVRISRALLCSYAPDKPRALIKHAYMYIYVHAQRINTTKYTQSCVPHSHKQTRNHVHVDDVTTLSTRMRTGHTHNHRCTRSGARAPYKSYAHRTRRCNQAALTRKTNSNSSSAIATPPIYRRRRGTRPINAQRWFLLLQLRDCAIAQGKCARTSTRRREDEKTRSTNGANGVWKPGDLVRASRRRARPVETSDDMR